MGYRITWLVSSWPEHLLDARLEAIDRLVGKNIFYTERLLEWLTKNDNIRCPGRCVETSCEVSRLHVRYPRLLGLCAVAVRRSSLRARSEQCQQKKTVPQPDCTYTLLERLSILLAHPNPPGSSKVPCCLPGQVLDHDARQDRNLGLNVI